MTYSQSLEKQEQSEVRKAKRQAKRKILFDRPKRKPRKTLVKLLDKKISHEVIARDKARFGKCPLCKIREITCAFHFVSRRKLRLRWNTRLNVIGTCWPCNSVFSGKWGGGNQTSAYVWYIEYYGYPQLLELEHESHMPPPQYRDWELEEMLNKP